MDLPCLKGKPYGHALFSVSSGIPDYAFYVYAKGRSAFICMSHPGDDDWEVYSFKGFFQGVIVRAVLCRTTLCCFYESGTCAFDVLTKSWLVFNIGGGLSFMLEHRGEILRVISSPPYSACAVYTFWRLNTDGGRCTWLEMDLSELENTALFLGGRQSFSVAGTDRKVFEFVRRDSVNGNSSTWVQMDPSELDNSAVFRSNGEAIHFVRRDNICDDGEDKEALTIHVYDHHAEGWDCKRLVSDSFPYTTEHSWVDMGISRRAMCLLSLSVMPSGVLLMGLTLVELYHVVD